MKTVEALSFLQYSAPTFSEAQRDTCIVSAQSAINAGSPNIVDKGHCLNVKVDNTDNVFMTVVPLEENYLPHVVDKYEPRKDEEYPVPSRYIEASIASDLEAQICAEMIHVICYTKEQLAKEGMEIESDYGVCALNPEMGLDETPMAPETLVRNSLGVKYGGNGVALDEDEYAASQLFWSTHILIK